tara:strand:- start:27 stop:1112 length:1086 start_codon:yes stop_codon:yes gene_type:complete
MESLFKDLGIFKFNESNDPSLKQGLEYDRYQKDYLDASRYELLERTTTSGLSSVIESMSASNSNNNTNAQSVESMKGIQNLDTKFQQLLSEYSTTLRLLNQEVVNKQDNLGTAKNMLGKVVTNTDADKVYVNNYGFTHKYSRDAWNANDKSCHSNSIKDNGDLSKFQMGPDMGVGQVCGAAGKNIQNSQTKEMAWVDIKGYKHVYSSDIWNKRSKNCSHRETISLTNDQYNAIPSGGTMTSTDICRNLDVDPKLYLKLIKLNKQLERLAVELVHEIDKLETTDAYLNAELQKQKSEINSHLDNLSSDRTTLQRLDNNYVTVAAQQDDSALKYTAENYAFVAWGLTALAIGGITFRQIMKTK